MSAELVILEQRVATLAARHAVLAQRVGVLEREAAVARFVQRRAKPPHRDPRETITCCSEK